MFAESADASMDSCSILELFPDEFLVVYPDVFDSRQSRVCSFKNDHHTSFRWSAEKYRPGEAVPSTELR